MIPMQISRIQLSVFLFAVVIAFAAWPAIGTAWSALPCPTVGC